MQIWVDADACPQVIKDILFRAAERAKVVTTLVSNMALARTPASPFIRTIRVRKGFDGADQRIVQDVQPGDLVVTADLPLAAAVVARGAQALDPRGELYTGDNVRERLAVRDLMQELRSGGELVGGPAPFRVSDRHLFANELDRFLARRPPA
ncbi:MAG: YaiI/YqxD family protein [Candidatus Rokubacteria bacterium]|nr:YaiI/YqxD family protein [Candidatus Rokubacteria bacterium]